MSGGAATAGPGAAKAAPGHRADTARGRSEVVAAERGGLLIADQVIAKIATQAAREALPAGLRGGAAPYATVTVHHGTARVRISVDLDYPCDIGARCAAVRRSVTQRVRALAGMAVRDVIVQVERLHLPQTPTVA